MKLFIKVAAVVFVLMASTSFTPTKLSAQDASVNFQVFYDQLSPNGSWVDYQNYGYVWVPNVDAKFTPYGSEGHWVLTDAGWTWVSDYSWGWAPFHYGRWEEDPSYGWLWIPGNTWGPAWVSWRRSPGYYGWAPMGPGISLEVSFGSGYRVPNNQWTFVGEHDMNRSDIDGHYVDRSTNVTIINNSTVINNSYTDNGRHTTYAAGPPREDVQKSTGATISPAAIRENSKPGQSEGNGQVSMYRPQVAATASNGIKPAPAKPVALADLKPAVQRTAGGEMRSDAAVARENKTQAPGKENASPTRPTQAAAAAQPHESQTQTKQTDAGRTSPVTVARPASATQPAATKSSPATPGVASSASAAKKPARHTHRNGGRKRSPRAPAPSGNKGRAPEASPPGDHKHTS